MEKLSTKAIKNNSSQTKAKSGFSIEDLWINTTRKIFILVFCLISIFYVIGISNKANERNLLKKNALSMVETKNTVYSVEKVKGAMSMKEWREKSRNMTEIQREEFGMPIILDSGVIKDVYNSTKEQGIVIVALRGTINTMVDLRLNQDEGLKLNKGENIRYIGTIKSVLSVRHMDSFELSNVELLDQ